MNNFDPKSQQLNISAPVRGLGDSQYVGAGDLRNLDISNIPGIAQLNLAGVKKSGTVFSNAMPMWAVINNDTNKTAFVVDSNHVVYTSDSSSTYSTWTVVTHASASTGHGNGLRIWKGYLCLVGDTLIDWYKMSTATWVSNGWAGFTLQSDLLGHPVFNSLDDKIYVGNSQYVNSIAEVAGQVFNPTSSITYTATDKAVTLPSSYRVRCLEELGTNLMIGTFVGSTLGTMSKVAKIYPWSRSGVILGIPISVSEAGIHQMININNELYFQAGTIGRWYRTNGSTSAFLTRIPRNLNYTGTRNTISYPGAILFHNSKIFTGLTVGGNGPSGVYSFNLDGKQLALENSISTSNYNGGVIIGCLLDVSGSNDSYLIGWQDATNTVGGIDEVGEDNFPGSYVGYFDSQMIAVGEALQNRTFTKLEFYLDTVFTTGQGIQISYRTDSQSAYTLLGTYTFASEGAVRFRNKGIKITNAEQIQVRVALTGGNGTPRFKYLILK